MYRYKNNGKISLNINNYDNNINNNLMKGIYLLIDKMNAQDLLYLKKVVKYK